MPSKSNSQPKTNDSITSSSLKPEGSSQTNERTTNLKASGMDLAKLTTLMESTQAMVVDDEQSEKELDEVLRKLDEANVLAEGIEGKVDALLATLEGMIGSLDAGDDEEDTHDSSHNPPANARQVAPSSSGHPNHRVGGGA